LIVPAFHIHPRTLDKSMVELTIRWNSLSFTHLAAWRIAMNFAKLSVAQVLN
jgi:hypothetical protein